MASLVQRGSVTFPGDSATTSVTITAGVDYTAPSSNSIIYITGIHTTGSGISASFNGRTDRNTVFISNITNIGTSITFTRYSSASSPEQVDWEILDFNQLPTTHSVVVRLAESLSLLPIANTVNNGTIVSGVVNNAHVVPVICSQSSVDNGRTNLPTAMNYLTWDSTNQRVVATRGATSTNSWLNLAYAVLEFTGSAWNVQSVVHDFTSGLTPETVTLGTALGSTSQAFIWPQYACDNAVGSQAYYMAAAWISSTTQITFEVNSVPATTKHVVAYVVEDTTGALNVQHISGSLTATTTSKNDTIATVPDISRTSLNTGALAYFTSGTATDNNEGLFGIKLTATNTVTIDRGVAANAFIYKYDVITWPAISVATTKHGGGSGLSFNEYKKLEAHLLREQKRLRMIALDDDEIISII